MAGTAYITDYTQWMESVQGWPSEYQGAACFFAGYSNIVFGTNPPVSAQDLLTLLPNFFGVPTAVQATADGATGLLTAVAVPPGSGGALAAGQLVTGPGIQPGSSILSASQVALSIIGDLIAGSGAILNVNTAGCLVGMPIAGPSIPAGTTITVVGATTLQMSAHAGEDADAAPLTVTAVSVQLTAPTAQAGRVQAAVYTAAVVPLAVVNVYLQAASASLSQALWGASWPIAISQYVAHFVTLWLRAQGTPAGSAAAAANAGLARGVLTSKSADGLSMSYQAVGGLESFGAWGLTEYGLLLSTSAKIIGAGSMMLY